MSQLEKMEPFELFSKIFSMCLILKNPLYFQVDHPLKITQNMEELIQGRTHFRAGTIGSNLF